MRSTRVRALKHIHDEAYYVIRAAEGWSPSYDLAPKQFKALVTTENGLYRKLRQYFGDFALRRVSEWVNWNAYQTAVVKAADYTVSLYTVPEDDSKVTTEETVMLGVMLDDIKDGMLQGVLGARETYTKWVGTAQVNDLISQQAIDHAAELAKGLTQTTLSDVQRSIQTSIKLGENIEQATTRLQAYISSPMRAQRIARTESVRAYNAGIHDYGKRTGAVTHSWESLPGADEGSDETPCLDDDAQGEIPYDDNFDSGDPYPPAHPNCRCIEVVQYDDTSDSTPLI